MKSPCAWATAIFIALLFCSGPTLGQETQASLRIAVYGAFGEPLVYQLSSLKDERSHEELAKCRMLVCTDLRFGRYVYSLRNPSNNDVLEGTVWVEQKNQLSIVDAYLGGSAARESSGLTILGTITNPPRGQGLIWVKLDRPFGDSDNKVLVDARGHFSISHVKLGLWVLSVFRGAQVLHSEEIVLNRQATSQPVAFEIVLSEPSSLRSIN